MESDLQNILNDLKKVWNDFHYYYARQDFFRFLISSLSSRLWPGVGAWKYIFLEV